MTQQGALRSARVLAGSLVETGPADYGSLPWIYCNPCAGLPPVVVESPQFFFGVQIFSGLAALLLLLAIEISQ